MKQNKVIDCKIEQLLNEKSSGFKDRNKVGAHSEDEGSV